MQKFGMNKSKTQTKYGIDMSDRYAYLYLDNSLAASVRFCIIMPTQYFEINNNGEDVFFFRHPFHGNHAAFGDRNLNVSISLRINV